MITVRDVSASTHPLVIDSGMAAGTHPLVIDSESSRTSELGASYWKPARERRDAGRDAAAAHPTATPYIESTVVIEECVALIIRSALRRRKSCS